MITALGTYEMYQVISPSGATWLQIVFAEPLRGHLRLDRLCLCQRDPGLFPAALAAYPPIPLAPLSKAGRTALLMPVYNENPERVLAGARGHGAARSLPMAPAGPSIFSS